VQRGAVLAGAVRATGDQQLDPRQPAQGRDHLVDALAPDEAAQHDDPGPFSARVHRPSGEKAAVSTPHGTTVVRRRGAPRRASSKTSSVQVAMTRSTRPTTARSAATRPGRARVVAPWWTALDAAEGVEGLHDGQVQPSWPADTAAMPGHPEVRVHDVGSPHRPVVAERPGEGGR
jgi:hypothetical protein